MTEISMYVAEYGYQAIFLFVFLQEIGIPNPISNELVLLYSGYLAYVGVLSLAKIIMVTVVADFTGTSILFFVFYAFGNYVVSHKPRWLPISTERIESMKQSVYKGGMRSIYIGRLIPFLRGYISVGAGLVQVKPKLFLAMVLSSALTWSGGLVLLGWTIGPYWKMVTQNMGLAENAVLILLIALGLVFAGRYLSRNFFQNKEV